MSHKDRTFLNKKQTIKCCPFFLGGGCPCFEGYFYNIDKYEHKIQILNIYIIFVFEKKYARQLGWKDLTGRGAGLEGVSGGIRSIFKNY